MNWLMRVFGNLSKYFSSKKKRTDSKITISREVLMRLLSENGCSDSQAKSQTLFMVTHPSSTILIGDKWYQVEDDDPFKETNNGERVNGF